MHVDADDPHAFEFGGAGVNLAGAADRHAEFVLGLAGRDLGMGPRINVGIDADRDVGGAPLAGGNRGEQFELRLGLDVDAEDTRSTAIASSCAVLPTPENMILSGGMPAASARINSPPETTSAPAPSRASVAITAWLELAFIA